MRALGRVLAGLGIMIALAQATPSQAQYFGQNKVQYHRHDWKSITSDHFEVYFYSGLDSLAMRVLDLAEKTNVMLSKRMGHTLGRRIPLIIYGSHNDFAETNVTPELIDPSTGGFTEVLRDRVVLPFTGSYEDLRHVVVHELTHAFMFDMLYGGSAVALLSRQSFYSVPLWFAEGMAEYFSLGIETNAEMFLRDGVIEGYLPPLTYSGGYLVYKQGQSALSYLVDRYGEDRLRDVLKRIRQSHNFDNGFERALGTPAAKFDQQWREWLRKRYWPMVATKEDPEQFARRLTDHRHDESNLNTAPAISPQGDRIAYFSDRHQYTDVYIMSALDGKVLRRLIRGERDVHFETIPSFRSSLSWSPDGQRLALTAKSGGRDVLYVVSVDNGKILHAFRMPCEALYYPAWSPVSDSMVVVGVKDGRSDLWMVDGRTARVSRLTNDTYDEKEPTWSPDGGTITFSSDRLAPVVLHPVRQEQGFGGYGIFSLDVKTGEITRTLDTYGDDHSPAWSPDGRKLAFISDRGGTPNIFLYNRADSSFTQLTDVLGGVQSLTWSRQNDRVVFSAFNRGGFDVFAVKEPLSLDAVVARLMKQSPHAVMSAQEARAPGADSVHTARTQGALAQSWPDSVTQATTDTSSIAARDPGSRLEFTGRVDTLRVDPRSEGSPAADVMPPAWAKGGQESPGPAKADAKPALASAPLVERGGPFAIPDSTLSQKPVSYRVKMGLDYAGAGFYAASGYGFAGSTQFILSDFLGDHNLYFATDVFTSSIEETNALAIYNYLPRRWDFGVGLFHFKNYFSSNVTTLGEQLGGPRLFSERNFGLLLSASYPFDRFHRVEFNFTQMFVDRKFFLDDGTGTLVQDGRQYRSVSSPSISLVHDNTLFGLYGPVNGQRNNLTLSTSLPWFQNGLAYHTATFDDRRYWDLTHGYTFAARALVGYSDGRDAQTFRVGGFNTLRGYPDFDLLGSRIAIGNLELRFPFIQQLGLVGPVPIGIFNLRGAVFTDFGLVWNEGDRLRLTHEIDGKRRLDDPKLGFGVGIRSAIYFLILKLDTAWNTDLGHTSKPRWHFSIGPEF